MRVDLVGLTQKEHGTEVVVAVAITMSWPYRKCALAITSTVTGNDDRPLLELANPCDATIGKALRE